MAGTKGWNILAFEAEKMGQEKYEHLEKEKSSLSFVRYAWSSLFFPTALVDISHGRLDLSPFASGNASKKLSGASTCHACAISIAWQHALNENAAGTNERTAVPGRLGEDLRSSYPQTMVCVCVYIHMSVYIYIWRFPKIGVPGTPKSSIYRWIVHYKPSSYWVPPFYGNTYIYI